MFPLFYQFCVLRNKNYSVLVMIEEQILDVIKEKLLEEGFRDCYIVELKITGNKRIQVYIDCDSGMTINKCAKMSRHVEHFLDESLIMGDDYILEVSSPGLDRPLIRRQFFKNTGRDLRIKLKDNKEIEGKLVSVDENGIILDTKNKKETKQIYLNFDDIEEAKVIIKFNKRKK